MHRYTLNQSEKPNHWFCTDTINAIVCIFEHQNFDSTAEFIVCDKSNYDTQTLTKLADEMQLWLTQYHPQITLSE